MDRIRDDGRKHRDAKKAIEEGAPHRRRPPTASSGDGGAKRASDRWVFWAAAVEASGVASGDTGGCFRFSVTVTRDTVDKEREIM
jgi:hypothetical protein